MIKSMTAFASQTVEGSWGILEVEMRSLNHRYLDIQLRLPEALRNIDVELRALIKQKIARGKIECHAYLKTNKNIQNEIEINKPLADAVLDACKNLTQKLHQPSEINPVDILAWPGVVVESKVNMQPIEEKLIESMGLLLEDFIENRTAEGVRLQAVLKQKNDAMFKLVADEKKRCPEILKKQRDKILKQLNDLGTQYDESRFEQELVYIAQKMDVDEELVRLESHLIEINNIFERDEPVGRRLDFIMQELNREANTLASKSVDITTTQASVELKILIEQMREQVQNIE